MRGWDGGHCGSSRASNDLLRCDVRVPGVTAALSTLGASVGRLDRNPPFSSHDSIVVSCEPKGVVQFEIISVRSLALNNSYVQQARQECSLEIQEEQIDLGSLTMTTADEPSLVSVRSFPRQHRRACFELSTDLTQGIGDEASGCRETALRTGAEIQISLGVFKTRHR